MATVLGFDPGLRGSGIAMFRDGELSFARWVKNPSVAGVGSKVWKTMAQAIVSTLPASPDQFVAETPQIYPGKSQCNPMWLLQLAGIVGALSASLETTAPDVNYLPREWKGSKRSKAQQNELDLSRLTEAERARITLPGDKGEHDDVYDAIGIGLFYLAMARVRPMAKA